jgi:outer membrane immunogenic protein
MNTSSKFAWPSLAAAGFVALLGTAPAFAADAVIEEPPAPAPIEELPVASWAGPYVGLQLGYGFSGTSSVDLLPGDLDIDTDGFIGGAFAGYQWQNGNWVYGLEGDLNYNGLEGSDAGFESESSIDGSIRARLGYAVTPDVLLYATAGGAAQSLEIRDAVGSDENTMLGWTAGVGTDVKFTEQMFGRVEYRYSDYGSEEFNTGLVSRDVDSSDHRVMFGLGYKF